MDLILAVEDLKKFHEENHTLNKNHYTMMNRATKNRTLYYFQNKGAKVHFNIINTQNEEFTRLIAGDSTPSDQKVEPLPYVRERMSLC